MSAKIGSSESKSDSHEGDAADFLFSNSKYHDCFLVVGNPETDEVEVIGAESLHLIAHSLVFREMLENNRVKDPSESKIHVTDVSPATFRLMLRYVYGGKLPKMIAVEAAKMALCADKFKIPRLVQKALKRLKPTRAEDVFPALICITSIKCSDLELETTKIIQRETKSIVQNPDFLVLDEDCVTFIMKQNTMNINEVELWKNVVRWAEHQVKINPAKTLRGCLMKILGYVRFMTLGSEEILEYVLPTKILTPEEFMDLTFAVTKKQPLESPLLCKILEKRSLYKEGKVSTKSVVGGTKDKSRDVCQHESKSLNFTKSHVFKASVFFELRALDMKQYSTLSINSSESIEIESLTCKSVSCSPGNTVFCKWYNCSCNITLTRTKKGVLLSEERIRIDTNAVYNEEIVLPMKLKNGQPLILNSGETCTINLGFNSQHPVYKLVNMIGKPISDRTRSPMEMGNVTFKYEDYIHVVEIAFKRQ